MGHWQNAPCLLPTDYPADDELAMVTVLPHALRSKAIAGS